ncbi:MAG: hypothetical protein KGQ49_03720 [Verrucomicrobia bacterium]|nr:hypothetical protein [Verrucomicrobiota bacterium]
MTAMVREHHDTLVFEAMEKGEGAVVGLLQNPMINTSISGNILFFTACDRGWTQVVTECLKRREFNLEKSRLIGIALLSQKEDMVLALLPHIDEMNAKESEILVGNAAQSGWTRVITELLKRKDVDHEALITRLLMRGLDQGEDAVLEVLETYPKVNAGVRGNILLTCACQRGWTRVVTQLVDREDVDLTVREYAPLFLAASNGHADIVELISLKMDPSVRDNQALTHAGNAAVARVLLADRRVNPNRGAGAPPIVMASAHGRRDVVEALLADPRVHPAILMGAALVWAHSRDHLGIEQLLLSDTRVNPNCRETYDQWFYDPIRQTMLDGMPDGIATVIVLSHDILPEN